MSRPWLLGERRTLDRRFEERSSGRSVARMSTERSVQSSMKMGSVEVPLHHALVLLSHSLLSPRCSYHHARGCCMHVL